MQHVDFARQCYREDSYYLSLTNIDKLSDERRILLQEEELLASGELRSHIIVDTHLPQMHEQVDIYRKERMLIYGCLMVSGKLHEQAGLVKTRQIHSPIFYFPANIKEDEALHVTIDSHDLRLNSVLLRQLLLPDIDTSIIDEFPNIVWPITKLEISKVENWLRANTVLANAEELVRWPSYAAPNSQNADKLIVSTSSCVVLADRTKGSRGTLHELKCLPEQSTFSQALIELFPHTDSSSTISSISKPQLLPSILSAAQKTALHNAAKYPISLISGPPGTGKSYTIAATAIDRMLQGESVVVVTKSDQATTIIGHLFEQQFGLKTGIVCANEQSFINSLKSYLNELLNEGVGDVEALSIFERKLKQSHQQLRKLQNKYKRQLWAFKHCHDTNSFPKKQMAKLYLRFTQSKQGNTFKLWELKQAIKDKQNDVKTQSVDFLNAYRANSLNSILLSQRKELVQFQSALKSRNSKTADERFAATNFDVVLKAFPIWLLNIDDLNRVLPFMPELFDLVIIDEATQCDIASAIPAFQRAKRACVVGDGKQLRHMSFLSKAKQEIIKNKAFGNMAKDTNINYREQSLLDIASNAIHTQAAVSLLNEHFRSKPELISFSNTYFYNAKLVVMQARPNVLGASSLVLTRVDGKRSSAGKNKVEKDAILAEILDIIKKYKLRASKPSIGVLSPYREQAQYIENAIKREFSVQQITDFRIKTATPFGFQGEERDIILLSFGIDAASSRAAAYLNRKDMFNVLITRAKQIQKVFYSLEPNDLSSDNLLRKYLTYEHTNLEQATSKDDVCQFAEQIKQFLEAEGVSVWIDDMLLGQQIDLICSYKNRLIAVDLIGYPGKFEDHTCFSIYGIFDRAGIPILPIPYQTWKERRIICESKLKELLLTNN